jgi:hypothetical protein
MSLYEENQNKAVVELTRRKQKIMDLKGSYGYADLVSGISPFLIQQQTDLLNRLQLAKEMGSGLIGPFLSYGDFTAFLQRFDLFDKTAAKLKEVASEIIEIGNYTHATNQFILANRAFLPVSDQKLLPENEKLYSLAKDYLTKAPMIQTFKRQNMRQTIIREALTDLKQTDIDRALKGHLILPDEIRDMSHMVDLTGDRAKNFESNLAYVSEKLGLKKEKAPYQEVHSKVKGVTFPNEGSDISRQIILGQMEEYAKTHPIYLNLYKTTFEGEPAYKVFWGHDKNVIEQIGWLDANLSKQLDHMYQDQKIPVVFDRITGGGVDQDGRSISRGCEITLRLPLAKEETKEVAKEEAKRIPDPTKEQHSIESIVEETIPAHDMEQTKETETERAAG